MKHAFADTFYWIARANRQDQWHSQAVHFTREFPATIIITTHEVLTEFLNFLSREDPRTRSIAVKLVRNVLENPSVRVIEQTRSSFENGLQLFASRLDKGYSLTDCVSMTTMRKLKITHVLTHDVHFSQEGFTILLKE